MTRLRTNDLELTAVLPKNSPDTRVANARIPFLHLVHVDIWLFKNTSANRHKNLSTKLVHHSFGILRILRIEATNTMTTKTHPSQSMAQVKKLAQVDTPLACD